MSRVVVTGGAGFIGSHLVDALLAAGHTVTVLDDFSTGRRENLPPRERLTLLEGSIVDRDLVARALDGAELLFHEAALPSVQRSLDDPGATSRVNIEGTTGLLDAALRAGVRRVIGAGSSSVYGDTPTLPKVETIPPGPLSPYAVSKLVMEKLFAVYYHAFGLETVVLRYFNVFGPRQDPSSQYSAVIPIFIQALLQGKPVTVHGDGEQSRDFSYIENVVHANLLAADAPGAAGRVINVACGGRETLNRLVEKLQTLAGTAVAPNHVARRAGDVKHSIADITLARSLLSYEPVVSFEEGLNRTFQWHLTHAEN